VLLLYGIVFSGILHFIINEFFSFFGGVLYTVIDLNWATKVACLVLLLRLFFFFFPVCGIVEVDVEV
jgi:membrane protein insertase Oxa1/YidC/SpoIIIJ